jgi:hypothetical protein
MPKKVRQPGEIRPGDVFEDCRFHPCCCYDISEDGTHIFGISLINGSTWQCCISDCGVRKLTPEEAWRWKSEGPALELALPSGRVIADVTENAIRPAIEGEAFAILWVDRHHYIRCARQPEPPFELFLEYQNGSIASQYAAVDGPMTPGRVLSAFLSNLRRDNSWQPDFQWERVES